MAAEFYQSDSVENIALNNPIPFESSIPCSKGYVLHENGTGNFILRGIVNNSCGCFARYQVTYNGNVAVAPDGEVTPIGIAISVNGETRPFSLAIFSPTGEEFGNLTSTAIITVPKGCCFNVAIRYVDATTDDATVEPTPLITVRNSNLVINRIA